MLALLQSRLLQFNAVFVLLLGLFDMAGLLRLPLFNAGFAAVKIAPT